jgi:nitrite reductase/ring-hydroxylating ferredoxin subunit
VVLAALAVATSACNKRSIERPVGYFKLGRLEDLAKDETYFSDLKILLRHDQGGFYAMSTACTYDGAPLTRVTTGGDERWESSYTASVYDARGHVLHGPTEVNLPYYNLKADSGVYGGPVDTLYVQVGVPRPEEWRLAGFDRSH